VAAIDTALKHIAIARCLFTTTTSAVIAVARGHVCTPRAAAT